MKTANIEDLSMMNEHKVEIFTLGRFLIRRNGVTISDNSNRSRKVWDLFKYLMINREKAIPPDVILETLWPEQDYSDPNQAIRSLVFRLRHLLAAGLSEPVLASSITFSHGCYKWDFKKGFWLDVEEFELMCRKANLLCEMDPVNAVEICQNAVNLYKGPFLPECSYKEWAINAQSYYHRYYMRAVFQLIELLKNANTYLSIIEVCEKAFIVEYYEEELHLRYLEALLKLGKTKQARAHYDEVTATFFRELGVKPSSAMQSVYRLLKADNNNFDLDLTFIQEGLRISQKTDGAFVCEPDVFRRFYKLETFRRERTGQAVFLGLLSVTCSDYRCPSRMSLEKAMQFLQDILVASLRKGDIISRWNDAQFLVILPGLTVEQAERVLIRIETIFLKNYNKDNIILHRKHQPLLPP